MLGTESINIHEYILLLSSPVVTSPSSNDFNFEFNGGEITLT